MGSARFVVVDLAGRFLYGRAWVRAFPEASRWVSIKQAADAVKVADFTTGPARVCRWAEDEDDLITVLRVPVLTPEQAYRRLVSAARQLVRSLEAAGAKDDPKVVAVQQALRPFKETV